MTKPEPTPFELSRVYAKGWNAGRAETLDVAEDEVDAVAERDNPYQHPAERARWAQGFKDGVRRNGAADEKRKHPSRR